MISAFGRGNAEDCSKSCDLCSLHAVGNHKKDVIGVSVGSTSAFMVLSIVVITTLIVVYKWRSRKRKLNGEWLVTIILCMYILVVH